MTAEEKKKYSGFNYSSSTKPYTYEKPRDRQDQSQTPSARSAKKEEDPQQSLTVAMLSLSLVACSGLL
jgi:hypothetical protein